MHSRGVCATVYNDDDATMADRFYRMDGDEIDDKTNQLGQFYSHPVNNVDVADYIFL